MPKKEPHKNNNKIPLEASLGMAIMDALPVLCFCVTILLIGAIFQSKLFIIGGILCVVAGCGKVLWKLLLATIHKNISLLNRQFRYLMPTGFLFIILSLFVNHEKLHFAVIWKNVSAFPCNLLFLLSLLGFVGMGVLGSRLDAADQRANWLEQAVNLFAQLCLLLGVLLIWYASDYYRADESVEKQYLKSTDTVAVSAIAQGYYFDGEGTETACIFYPGAKVEYTAPMRA